MAMTRKEASERLARSAATVADVVERKIDAELANMIGMAWSPPYIIDFMWTPTVELGHKPVRDEIERRYKAVGWKWVDIENICGGAPDHRWRVQLGDRSR